MDTVLHASGGAATLVAGICFALAYIFGLWLGRKMDKSALWPAIVVGVICCLVRGYSEPLGVVAVAAVSVLHYVIGYLTILIFRSATTSSRSN